MPSLEPFPVKPQRPHLLRLRLGNAVWACRMSRNMTQESLARRLGTSRQAISSLERGIKLPTVALCLRVAAALDLRPVVLLRMARL